MIPHLSPGVDFSGAAEEPGEPADQGLGRLATAGRQPRVGRHQLAAGSRGD